MSFNDSGCMERISSTTPRSSCFTADSVTSPRLGVDVVFPFRLSDFISQQLTLLLQLFDLP
jgi:hypothetical protein